MGPPLYLGDNRTVCHPLSASVAITNGVAAVQEVEWVKGDYDFYK